MRSPLVAVALLLTGCEALTGSFHVDPGGMGGGGGAAGSSDGGSGAGPCGGVDMLVDDFAGGISGPPWIDQAANGGLLTEEDGAAVIRLPAGNASASRVSQHLHDLRESEVRIEIVEAPSTPEAYAFLRVAAGVSSISIAGPGIINHPDELVVMLDGVVDSNLSFLPGVHRWWRIRERSGEIFAEFSPDGQSWTVLKKLSGAEAFDVAFTQVSFGAANANMMESAEARFDRLNGGGTFEPRWCKAKSFTDDFESDTAKPEWTRNMSATGCIAAQGTGQVVMAFDTLGGGVTNGCTYHTGRAYDLIDSSASIQVADNSLVTTDESEAPLFLRLRYSETSVIELFQPADMLEAWATVGGESQLLAVLPAQPWWRFREASGTLFWEVSADGVSWQAFYETGHPFPLDALEVIFGMGYASLSGATGDVRFDNFNLP